MTALPGKHDALPSPGLNARIFQVEIEHVNCDILETLEKEGTTVGIRKPDPCEPHSVRLRTLRDFFCCSHGGSEPEDAHPVPRILCRSSPGRT